MNKLEHVILYMMSSSLTHVRNKKSLNLIIGSIQLGLVIYSLSCNYGIIQNKK